MSLDAGAVVNTESGAITLGDRTYSMDRRRTHGPNSWILIANHGINVVVLLRDGEGKPFAYAACETFQCGTLKHFGAWFGTASPCAEGQGGARFMYGLGAYTSRNLGIAELSYHDQCAIPEQMIRDCMEAWLIAPPGLQSNGGCVWMLRSDGRYHTDCGVIATPITRDSAAQDPMDPLTQRCSYCGQPIRDAVAAPEHDVPAIPTSERAPDDAH